MQSHPVGAESYQELAQNQEAAAYRCLFLSVKEKYHVYQGIEISLKIPQMLERGSTPSIRTSFLLLLAQKTHFLGKQEESSINEKETSSCRLICVAEVNGNADLTR